MGDLNCNRHIVKLHAEAQRRAVERLITRSHDPNQQTKSAARFHSPYWREQTANGSPVPSMHNARLAITAMGVECSYDTFHNKMLFGYKDDTVRHVLEPILGEVSDNGIIGLRRLLSDRFGFDLTERHVRDAVISLALQHCFDPVADMLAEAEAEWDGVERLDSMAASILQLRRHAAQRACIRKTMIAGVRRVRQPGCKFDNIPTLEAKEGLEQEHGNPRAGHGRRELFRREHHRQGQPRSAGAARHDLDARKRRTGRNEESRSRIRQGIRQATVRSRPAGLWALPTRSSRDTRSNRAPPTPRNICCRKPATGQVLADEGARDDRPRAAEAAIGSCSGAKRLTTRAKAKASSSTRRCGPLPATEQEKRRVKDPWEEVLADMPRWSRTTMGQ